MAGSGTGAVSLKSYLARHTDDCHGVTFNADEQLHARVAYQRPNGNRDVDIDPISFQAITTGDEPRITCRKRRSAGIAR